MNVILKYEIRRHEVLQLLTGSRVLAVNVQHDKLCCWVLAPSLPVKIYEDPAYQIRAYHTGDDCDEAITDYQGTFIMRDGVYVLHVFFNNAIKAQ